MYNDDSIYKKLYYSLFNAVSDGIGALEAFDAAGCLRILKAAQIKCEELYITQGDNTCIKNEQNQ